MKANGPSSKGHENLWKADFFADFCKRHSVELQLDAEGNSSLQMLAQFGLLFLEAFLLNAQASRGPAAQERRLNAGLRRILRQLESLWRSHVLRAGLLKRSSLQL